MTKSFFEKLHPSAIGKNLWGPGKMPTHWKILFTVQSLVFVSAMWMRTIDVQNVQRRKLESAGEEDNIYQSGEGEVDKTISSKEDAVR